MLLQNTQPQMLTVQIAKAPDGTFAVSSVEILNDFIKHKLQFSGQKTIEEVFQQNVSEYLTALMDKVTECPMVLSEPDAIETFGGLALGRLRVLVTKSKGTTTSIAVRFQYFVGSIQELFRIQSGFNAPTLPHREAISARALETICAPLYSIAAYLDCLPRGQRVHENIRVRIEALRLETIELQFYTELLRRYSDDCARERDEQDSAAGADLLELQAEASPRAGAGR